MGSTLSSGPHNGQNCNRASPKPTFDATISSCTFFSSVVTFLAWPGMHFSSTPSPHSITLSQGSESRTKVELGKPTKTKSTGLESSLRLSEPELAVAGQQQTIICPGLASVLKRVEKSLKPRRCLASQNLSPVKRLRGEIPTQVQTVRRQSRASRRPESRRRAFGPERLR